MAVFVLDKRHRPLMPCSEKRARLLLARGRAVVVRLTPFTIRLKDRVGGETQPLRLKLDPGSRTTGLALVREAATVDPATGALTRTEHVLWLGELTHRGAAIRAALTARRALRRRRRTANRRHRPARFANRRRPAGWLAPSLRHRLETTAAWVARLRRLAPLTALSQELVRFDMQAMQHPEIAGVEYQQGTLAGYEVRAYLLEKWQRTCASCGAQAVPLQIEHIQPTSAGGSHRISNLTLACAPCNRRKGNRLDALHGWAVPTLAIRCTGRGSYQRTRLNGHGFPRGYLVRRKRIQGFQTGDRVRASVPSGTKSGVHVGRVAVRATGSFNIQTPAGVVQGIAYRHCRVLQRADGYGYSFNPKPTEVASRGA